METENIVARAVRLAGGVTQVAKAMNIRSTWSIYKWIYANRVPPRRIKTLVRLTNNQVTREELDPELFAED